MKKKILFVHHARTMGGAPTSMLNIIRNLDKSKFDVKILFIFENPSICMICERENIRYSVLEGFFFRRIYNLNTFSEADNVSKLYRLRIYPVIRNYISWIAVAFYYSKRIITKENPDVVHFNSTFLSDWLFGIRKLNLRKVVHVREPLASRGIGIKRLFYRFILAKYSDAIFAISLDNKKRLNLSDKTKVVYNFMDKPRKAREKTSSDGIKVVYLGGGVIIKGYVIVKAAAHLLKPHISIIMAGELRTEELAQLPGNIEYVGLVNDVYDLLLTSDVLIFPSTLPHFAKPLIEAGMCKLPVIASNVDGMDEILINGFNGLLVQPNNPVELASAINKLASDPILMTKYGNNNYDLVKDKFSIEANLPTIENAYLT